MIVVTGAAGFIGSNLVDRLLRDGEVVSALDLPRSPPPNLAEPRSHPHFRYEACDIRDLASLEKHVPPTTDAIFHLASSVGVKTYVEKPLETIDTIVGGTRNVVEVCLRRKARLVYLSTSEVYGRNPAVPWSEESDRVLGPPSVNRWSYSTSKGLCEHLVNAVHQDRGLPTTIIRPFNVYGPRQRPVFLVPAAIHRTLRGERPLVYDTGSQTRCFTYVEDIVEGLARVRGPKGVGQTFNLGSQEEHTVSDVVRMVIRACGVPVEPIHVQTSQEIGKGYEDVPRRVPDSSRAIKLLGWAASTKLEDGLRATVDWAKRNPDWLALRS
jgi:UDP-glucose 4-epimerase